MDSHSLHASHSLDDESAQPEESGRIWRHPLHRSIKVPYATAVAMALIQMGVRDYAVIARAACLRVEDVRRIDMTEDCRVRQLGVAGIPHGVYFRLHERVRCPRCKALVKMAPCIACDTTAKVPWAEFVETHAGLTSREPSHR